MSKSRNLTKFNIIYIIYKYLDWKIEFAEIELLIKSTILWISFYIDNLIVVANKFLNFTRSFERLTNRRSL